MSTYAKYQKELEEVIGKARIGGWTTVQAPDGAEIYGYPRRGGRIAWGVNAPETGWNLLRGIRLPDGSDTGVM